MIQMCFGECDCWVQRQCIWELAITKGKSDNQSDLMLLSLESKYKKKKRQKQKEPPNEPALNNNVLDSLRRGQTACFRRRNIGGLYAVPPHQAQLRSWPRTAEVVCGILVGDMQRTSMFDSRTARFAKSYQNRDNTHKQTTFIIFFSLKKICDWDTNRKCSLM